jgi:CubicO group peptidase (beta-lactamase class C family)
VLFKDTKNFLPLKKPRYMRYTFLILLLCFNRLVAQTNIQRIDSLLQPLFEQSELTGNILVAEKGTVSYTSTNGCADVVKGTMLTHQSAFELASLSKPFTAIAILQLRDKGKLQLDKPVSTYLPDFKYGNITIRHLLSHTSGLADFQMLEAPYKADTRKVFANGDIVAAINQSDRSILFPPGERWSYSNSGYVLLALIVEKRSGLSFPSYLDKYIFKPAGMRHTYLNTELLPVADTLRATGYDYPEYAPWKRLRVDSLPGHRVELHNLGGLCGHGNIVSTLEDLLLFDRALYGNKLLAPATLREAFTPTRLNNQEFAEAGWGYVPSYYGLGWKILKDSSYGRIVYHPGGMPGAVTILLRNITKDQTVIMLDNVTHRGVHTVAVDVLRLLNQRPTFPFKKSLAGDYARALVKTDADAALAAFNMHKTDSANYYLSEQEMNMLGLQMFYNGYQPPGLEALRLNTVLFPNSANVYDSYAEALKHIGKKKEALLMFRKSLDLNPGNQSARRNVAELEGAM